ncbi:MAG: glycosyltransferase family 4 protein [Phycisphaerae bacterium]
MQKTLSDSTVAFIGDYPPRKCGIATFTADLCEALATTVSSEDNVFAVAVSDLQEGYPYPSRVRFEIREKFLGDYHLAANYLNIHDTAIACLQHEYGIFGGPSGSHVLTLMNDIRCPIVSVLHTVLKSPTEEQRAVLGKIAHRSDKLVVMSEVAREILLDGYDVPAEKVRVIPHGIPDVPFIDPNYYKDKFEVAGKNVLLTFGLLSPGKGIEQVIDALPDIVSEHPDTAYIVLGATHPNVKRDSGEQYRNALQRRASELGVADNVLFHNRFVQVTELCEYLGAADVYVTPYVSAEQVSSGTLAYAMGSGKAVVSTPYWYAEEMLAENRGLIVPFQNPPAMAEAVKRLLSEEMLRHQIRKKAYKFSRRATWPRVAQEYLDVFEEARELWAARRLEGVRISKPAGGIKRLQLPEVDLRHMKVLSDDTGIYQHTLYLTPDRSHGYCTDDNARALMAAVLYWDQTRDESIIPLIQRYLGFLLSAFNGKTQRFRNFMSYDRTWLEEVGSQDSHARALWGLGTATAMNVQPTINAIAARLFRQALPASRELTHYRAWGFSIVGIEAYLKRFSGDTEARRIRDELGKKLLDVFLDYQEDDWPWLQDLVSYANAKLPHALLICGRDKPDSAYMRMGLESLRWLIDQQTDKAGMLSIIGNNGWMHRDGTRASFDQQPIEAHSLVEACIEAYDVTGDEDWIWQAKRAFDWFLGDNDLRQPVVDFTTGGCRDGLQPDRVNENQGAESTLAWLISLLRMHDLANRLAFEDEDRQAKTTTTGEEKPLPAKKPLS